METYAVEFQNVTYKYSGNAKSAIHNINLRVKKGECILFVGASGSGKTSISRCINGLIPHFHEGELQGEISIMGKNTSELTIGDIGRTVGSVFQEPKSQFFMTDTTSEVAFGCTNRALPREEIWKRTNNSFKQMNIEMLKDKSIFKLSSGEMQKVAVASCYAMEPEVYIFDEPSANLDIPSIYELAQIMKKLKEQKKTICVFEHRLFYLAKLFDRMVYIKNGKIEQQFSNEEANSLSDKMLAQMGLRNFNLRKLEPSVPLTEAQQHCNAPYLEVEHIAFTHLSKKERMRNPVLQDVSFAAQQGEVIGIVGENGAGKTTLARICCGLIRTKMYGTIKINGYCALPRKRIGNLYFVMQDSDYQLFSDSVWNELTIGKKRKQIDTEKNISILAELGLLAYKDMHPAALSRGQKQRLTIAGALVNDSKIIFFDEPTSGLDRYSMTCVAKQIQDLVKQERIVIVITHDYEFLLSVCTRILHLKNGTIQDDFMLTVKNKEKLLNILWEGGQ